MNPLGRLISLWNQIMGTAMSREWLSMHRRGRSDSDFQGRVPLDIKPGRLQRQTAQERKEKT